MKVYVITAGHYAYSRICGVTTDPESAENLRLLSSASWSGEARIEIYETQEVPDRPKTYFEVTVSDEFGLQTCLELPMVTDNEYYINCVTYRSGIHTVSVIAEDKSHAVEIAKDLITKYKRERGFERKVVKG